MRVWVCEWDIGVTQTKLHFFQYIQASKPFPNPVPPNTKQYQLILTKYQPVLSYSDPVSSSTTYNWSSCMAQFSQLNNFSFYGSFDESRTVQNTWSCCDVNLMQNCFKNGEINTTIVNLVSVKKIAAYMYMTRFLSKSGSNLHIGPLPWAQKWGNPRPPYHKICSSQIFPSKQKFSFRSFIPTKYSL